MQILMAGKPLPQAQISAMGMPISVGYLQAFRAAHSQWP